MDESGRKATTIPPAIGTTETALKALVYLWEAQRAYRSPYINKEPSPRKDKMIRDTYRDYNHSLVFSEEFKRTTSQRTCVVRDSYIEREFIIILAFIWR